MIVKNILGIIGIVAIISLIALFILSYKIPSINQNPNTQINNGTLIGHVYLQEGLIPPNSKGGNFSTKLSFRSSSRNYSAYTDKNGRFTTNLPPNIYSINFTNSSFYTSYSPKTIKVTSSNVTFIDIIIYQECPNC